MREGGGLKEGFPVFGSEVAGKKNDSIILEGGGGGMFVFAN